MARLTVPTVACIIGRGRLGRRGRDRRLRPGADAGERDIYSVITPEGCAAILWRDAGEAKKGRPPRFKPDALHCLELGVIDGIVAEPDGGAQNDHDGGRGTAQAALVESLEELEDTPGEELRRRRRAKFRGMGVFA